MNLKFYLVSVMVIAFVFSAAGQPSDLVQKTKDQFSESTDIKWVKKYKGILNDFNQVAIVLGYDGFSCKGIMKYLRSGEEFSLEGFLNNENLILKEIDSQNRISGYIRGNLVSNSFSGTWSNFDNTVGCKLVFESTSSKNLLPTYCGKDKWMRKYTAVNKKDVAELSLQRLQEDHVRGTIYLKKENKTYQVVGTWSAAIDLELTITDDFGEIVGQLNAPESTEKSFKAFLTVGSKKVLVYDFLLSSQLKTGCIEFADYSGMYDIIYPRTNFAKFNDWIEKVIREESSKIINRTSKVAARNSEKNPENRAKIRSGGWFETGFFNDKILSGILVFQSTIAQQQHSISVNFDLVNGRPISFEDIFRKEYDLDFFINSVVRKDFQKSELYKTDPAFKDWIKKVPFPHFILLRNGVCFSSGFNAIYGRQRVTIPYSKLTGFITKDISAILP